MVQFGSLDTHRATGDRRCRQPENPREHVSGYP